MRRKIKVGIIGTGNIGSDLLVKIQRSSILECGIFTGINQESQNIKRARSMGIKTSFKSIQAIIDNPSTCEIVFDATSAKVHLENAPLLRKLKKFVIDLTPSQLGILCVPSVNLDSCLRTMSVNMITCGAQATIPLISAIMNAHPDTEYVEIVSSISSKSAGIGTRNNIDEYTRLTTQAIEQIARVPKAKSIIIINPSEPPIHMQNTIYASIKKPKLSQLKKELDTIVFSLRRYVPGFTLMHEPLVQDGKVIVMSQVSGLGDFLPEYAGNLDVMTCAATVVAEEYARKKMDAGRINVL